MQLFNTFLRLVKSSSQAGTLVDDHISDSGTRSDRMQLPQGRRQTDLPSGDRDDTPEMAIDRFKTAASCGAKSKRRPATADWCRVGNMVAERGPLRERIDQIEKKPC